MIVGGHGLGPTIGGWIEYYDNLQWRWIGWIQMMCVSLFFSLLVYPLSSFLLHSILVLERRRYGKASVAYLLLRQVSQVVLAPPSFPPPSFPLETPSFHTI